MPRFGKLAALLVFLALLVPIKAEAIETAQFRAGETPFQHRGPQEIAAQFEDTNTWFDRNYQLIFWTIMTLPYLSLAGFIGFVLWDWKHPPRPVKRNVPSVLFGSDKMTVEDELSHNPDKLHSLLEAFRSLGKSNEQVADVLRQFRLL